MELNMRSPDEIAADLDRMEANARMASAYRPLLREAAEALREVNQECKWLRKMYRSRVACHVLWLRRRRHRKCLERIFWLERDLGMRGITARWYGIVPPEIRQRIEED